MALHVDGMDAVAALRNVLQGMQSWLDVAERGKRQPELPQAYVERWKQQLEIVLILVDTQR